jgi:signal peptidase
MVSSIRTAGRFTFNVLLVVVFLGSAAFVAPSLMGYERYVITTGSMTGTYDPGSIVFDEKVPTEQLAVGDAITYQPPAVSGIDQVITHRIVSIDRTGTAPVYRTKGDANPQRDPWTFQLSQPVQPRVSYSVPYAGHVFLALADRHTRMLFIGIPAALIALLSLVEVARALRPRRDRVTSAAGSLSGPVSTA